MNLLSLILASLVCVGFYVYQNWRRNKRFYELFARIPNVGTFFGTQKLLFDFVGADNKKCMDLLFEILKPGPSSPRKFWVGPYPNIIVDDPDQLRKVLSSRNIIDKPPNFFAAFSVPKGIFQINGDAWRQRRKLLEPAFHATVLKSFLPIFNENNQIMMQVLAKRPEGVEFDLTRTLESISLDNLLNTSTGIDKHIQTEENNEYLHHCVEGLKIIGVKIVKFWLQSEIIMKMTKLYELEQKHVINGMFKIADEIIEQKERNFKEVESNKPQIFIDQLYKMRKNFSKEKIRDDINTVIIAGFDTVATTLTLMVLLIAMHPRVQDKLYEELNRVFDSVDEEVTQEKLDQLTYMELVIKESIRIWPAISISARMIKEDIQLGDYVVPSGTAVVMPIYAIHHNKTIWGEDVEEFRPERFEPDEIEKIPLFAILNFSRGPRNCIGYKYAMDSMKITLSYLFRKYKVLTSTKMEDVEFEFSVLMKLHKGCNVSLHRR